MEDESYAIYTGLQQTQCMRSKGKSTFCIVNTDTLCISSEMADLKFDKV